jgi:mono/diheme cytochrome c family protein
MFTTTVSMWLGILFLALAIIAVLLQAWLWGPKYWDEDAKRTRAPKSWLRVHMLVGYTYACIYFFMMWNMLPRLWEYQYELPARTVIHAVVAIVIGVILITKIMILRFFRHFEEAIPRLAFGLLVSTVVLIVLSVPYALRAHDFSGAISSPENVERVERLLANVEFEVEVDKSQLATPRGFDKGRTVLVTKCTACHDMRTILIKPRTAHKWHDVSARMLEKPAVFGDRLHPEDIPWVTAYLVAITPDIQRSVKRRRETNKEERQNADAVSEAVHMADDFEAPKIDDAAAQALLEAKCTECHELDEVEEHGGDDVAGWRSSVAAMVEEGAEISDEEAAQLATYLAKQYPGGAAPPPLPVDKPEPQPDPEPADAGEDGTGGSPDLKDPFKKDEPKRAPKKKKKPKKKADEGEEPAEEKPAPPPKPKADAKAGQALFLKKCKACHGPDGKAQTAYGQKIGVSDLTSSGLGGGGIRKVIKNGVSGTKMRGYGSKLSAEEIDNLVAFVRSL